MIYKWVKMDEVLARIARNIRLKDESYFADIPEWIAEAVFKMKTRYQYELKYKSIRVDLCQAKLPCDGEALAAIVYQNKRILPSSSDGPLYTPNAPQSGTSMDNMFHSVLKFPSGIESLGETSVNNWPEYVKSSSLVESMSIAPDIRYRINFNKIEIGVQHGHITVFYWALPADETGFPLIPDHDDYKSAIYWYVRSMMIGAGYPDTVFNFDYCFQQWERYADRAMNDITYPTADEAEASSADYNRFINIGSGWEHFFNMPREGGFDY